MAYDAGTAFLQIVPSFRGIQDELKSAAASVGSTLSAAVADALPKGVAEGAKKAEKQAENAGRSAGQAFGGAMNKQIAEAARKAAQQLPDIKIRANADDVDREVEKIRVRLAEIGDKKIDVDFDTQGLFSELIQLRAALTALQRQAADRTEIAFDTHAGAEALKTLSAAVADALPKGVEEGAKQAEKQAETAGSDAGLAFGGALNRQIKDAAYKAAQQLPDIKIRADADDVDREVEKIRVRLAAIGDQKIDIDFDTHGLWSELYQLRAALTALQRQAADRPEISFDTHAGAEALKTIDTMFDDVDRRGMDAWGKFSKGFNDSAKSAKLTLPELDVAADDASTRAMLNELHDELERLGKVKINVDVDEDTALADMRATMAKLDALAERSTLQQVRVDAGDAAKNLRGFLGDEQEQEKVGEEAAERVGGALVTELKKIMAEASAAIGDIDVDVDVDAGEAAAKLAILKAELEDLNKRIGLDLEPSQVIARLKEIREEIEQVQRAAGRDIELNFDTDAAGRALQRTRELERKAELAGLRAGGAFNQGFQQRIGAAESAIGDVRIGASSTDFDERLVAVKDALAELKDQHIGVDLDVEQARRKAYALERELEDIANNSPVVHQRYDAERARKQLAEFAEMAKSVREQIDEAHGEALKEQAERDSAALEGQGKKAAGSYIDGFRNAIRASQERIPDLEIDADSTRADKALADIKRQLTELGDKKIGVDISAEDALKKLRILQARLQAMSDHEDIDVRLRVDAAAARRDIDKFFADMNSGTDAFDAKMRAAMDNIPHSLASVRQEMDQIRDARINMRIDDAEAKLAIDRLRAQLTQLAATSPDVQVRVDAATALAQLKLVQAEADKTERAVSGIANASVSGVGRLAALVFAGASLGSIVVPAAAAAAVAIAGIAAAAGTAVAGIGVVALGLFGITDAVQALNKAQEDQAKTAKSLGASNKAMAGAQDQLRSAEQSLASARENAAEGAISSELRLKEARENAADAAITSEQRLQDARENAARNNIKASQDLKDAQDAERESREALNDAIKEAQLDMAGLDLQVRKNALSQREATARIAEERLKLAKVLSDPKATQLDREKAQIAFDERVLQLKELQFRGTELHKQQREYAKDGVEASDKVKAARKREEQAGRKLGDAEADIVRTRKTGLRSIADAERAQAKQQRDSARSIADAQRAQAKQHRDSARAITSAQQQIVSANRAVQQSLVASSAAGGAALGNLETAMGKLSPAGQNFAKFIFGLKDEFKSLTDTAQTALLPGLQSGIQGLLRYLTPLQGFIQKMGTALGGMFGEFVASLQSPVWRDFFSYFDEIAVPTMQAMFDITGNVSEAMAALFVAMKPFTGNFLQGLVNATQRFSEWAQQLTRTHEYVDFLEYVARVGPKVVELIKNMGEFIAKIVIAAAPIGEVVVDAFNKLFDWLNSISTIKWTAILGVMAVFGLAAGTVAALTGALRKLYAIAVPVLKVIGFLTTMVKTRTIPAFKGGAASSMSFGNALKTTGVKAGIAGAAIAVLTAGLLYWYTESEESKARVDDLSDALGLLAEAYKETGSMSSAQVQETVKANEELQGLVNTTDKYAISLERVAKASLGNEGAQRDVTEQYKAQIKALEERRLKEIVEERPSKNPFAEDNWSLEGLKKRAGIGLDSEKTYEEIKALEEQRKALQQRWEATKTQLAAESSLRLANSREITNEAVKLGVQNEALQKNQTRIDELNQFLINNETAEGRASNAAKWFSDALDKQSLAARTNMDTGEAFASGLINLKNQVNSAKQAHDAHATSLEFNSTHLEKNSATALANRDSIQALAAQSRDAFLADIAAGVAVDTARKAHEKRLKALKDESHQLDLNRDDVQALIDTQGKIDKNITTDYDSKDFDTVYMELLRLNFMQDMIKQGITDPKKAEALWGAYQARMVSGQFATKAKGSKPGMGGKGSSLAEGGPVRGPGTKTSDDVPIWASQGEFMQRAAAVDYYGTGVMHAINDLRIPKNVFGYAGGGLIHDENDKRFRYAGGGTMPVVIDYSNMVVDKPTKAEAEQIVLDEMGGFYDMVRGGVASGSLEVARIAEATARRLRATDKQLVALMEAGLVESGMRNLSYGDRDSVGFLQQRAGWGSVAQRMNVDYATRKFIDKAKRVDRANYTAGELAQAVQVSAFPSRYEQRLADAVAVIDRESPYLKGYGEGIGVRDGGRGWRWQMQVLRRVFPALALISGYRPGSKTLSGNLSMHARDGGRAVDVTANRNVARYIHDTFGKRSVELITPWREYNMWHGEPHRYSDAVERQHGVGAAGNDHVHWAFDQGGWLPPGYRNVVNATGKPEAVFTASQFEDIRSLADATRASVMNTNNNTAGSTYQFDFGNSTLTGARLEALQRRQESLARVARPNY